MILIINARNRGSRSKFARPMAVTISRKPFRRRCATRVAGAPTWMTSRVANRTVNSARSPAHRREGLPLQHTCDVTKSYSVTSLWRSLHFNGARLDTENSQRALVRAQRRLPLAEHAYLKGVSLFNVARERQISWLFFTKAVKLTEPIVYTENKLIFN